MALYWFCIENKLMREPELQPMRDYVANHLRHTYEHLGIPIKSVGLRTRKFIHFAPNQDIRASVDKYNAIITKLKRDCPEFFKQDGLGVNYIMYVSIFNLFYMLMFRSS